MKVGLSVFSVGVLVWILLTSLAVSLWFSQRVRRVLKAQRKPLDLAGVKALCTHDEYSRSDVYGALVSWIGCAVAFVALMKLVFQRLLR